RRRAPARERAGHAGHLDGRGDVQRHQRGAAGYPRAVSEELASWHDFNVSLVTASAALLGLLFVALSIHVRTLSAARNAELRSIARSIFLGYVTALGIGFVQLVPQSLFAVGAELLLLVLLPTLP